MKRTKTSPKLKGVFITFEGIEGCGKTTQIELLARFLRAQGLRVVLTRQPGGTELGKNLRNMLLRVTSRLSDMAELLLYEADRAEHVSSVILPELKKGAIVLCDRFSDSTIAYQSFGRGIDRHTVEYLNTIASAGCTSDLTIVIDAPLAKSINKARMRSGRKFGDRLESENMRFHKRVKQGFSYVCRRFRARVKCVRQKEKPKDTFADIQAQVVSLLKRKGLLLK
jgi:dTMP kinase